MLFCQVINSFSYISRPIGNDLHIWQIFICDLIFYKTFLQSYFKVDNSKDKTVDSNTFAIRYQ